MSDTKLTEVNILTFVKTQGEQSGGICHKYAFEGNNGELFALQAVVPPKRKGDKLCLYEESNYTSYIPTQFIITIKGTKFRIKNFNSISDYYNNIVKYGVDFEGLKSTIDYEFIAQILSAKVMNVGKRTSYLDLGIDEALVYAYIFTHTELAKHEQIRLFDWENINNGQHGFEKNSLQPNKIKATLNFEGDKMVYLSVIVNDNKGLNHISFTTVAEFENNIIVESFDTLGLYNSNEQYIKTGLSGQQQLILKSKIEKVTQENSGCGFLTALNAVNYINGKLNNNNELEYLSIVGKEPEEIRKILIGGFGYTCELDGKEYKIYRKKDKEYGGEKDGKRGDLAFEISVDEIQQRQQINERGMHGIQTQLEGVKTQSLLQCNNDLLNSLNLIRVFQNVDDINITQSNVDCPTTPDRSSRQKGIQ